MKSGRKPRRTGKSAVVKSDRYFVDPALLQRLRFESEPQVRQERAKRSQEQIVTAALQAFMENSYDGVSTHDIAQRAKVTQGLITYHFKSKEGVWQASMDHFFGDFRNELANRISELNDIDDPLFYKLIIRHIARWPSQHPFMTQFMAETGRHHRDRIAWIVERHIRPVYQVLGEILSTGKSQGIIKDLPTLNLHYLLMTASSVFSLREEILLLSDIDVQSADFIDEHTETMVKLFIKD